MQNEAALVSDDKCTSYYARMKYLQQASVSDVQSYRSHDGKSILDMFIEDAAWNRVESNTNWKPFWANYVMVIADLYKMNVPMTLALNRDSYSVWWEGANGGFFSPMCWDGIIGLALQIGPNDFKPLQWGAHDFISEHLLQETVDKPPSVSITCGGFNPFIEFLGEDAFPPDVLQSMRDMMGDDIDRSASADQRAFFFDLAVCVLDWELHAPQLRMLDKYRRLGGTLRVAGGSVLLDLFTHVAEVSSDYHDQDDADPSSKSMSKANVVMAWTEILERWQAAEHLWSDFLIRTLAEVLPRSCADIIDSFLLGAKFDTQPKISSEKDCEEGNPPVVTEYIEHEEAAAVVDPTEAAEISNQRWAGFVQDRHRIIAEMRDGLPDSSSAESGSMIWMESNSEMPPFELEWTGQISPRASQFGDTVYLIGLTRAGRNLQAAISGVELESVRNNIRQAGFEFKLPCGAHILLYPNQYTSIQIVLNLNGLQPHHILINEAFLPLLLNEIRKLPSRSNVRCSSVRPAALVGDDQDVAIVEKTFFNFEPRLLRGVASVTQSVTDARHGVNPRRVRAGLGSIMCCGRRVQPSKK